MDQMTFQPKKDIVGWGVDADLKNRPAVPQWSRPLGGTGSHWDVPPQQNNFKDLFSIERDTYTHVFGTSAPPSGLSGLIRRLAFRYSEGSFGHWLPLLLADRINMVEGIFTDLLHGKIPNLYKEMGLATEWRYNRKNFVLKTTIISGLIAAPVLFLLFSGKKNQVQTAPRRRASRSR
jgi:hypothetical protein